jgi:hypothetical protein
MKRDRKKNEIKKKSSEYQHFTVHAWNGDGRRLNLQQWEPIPRSLCWFYDNRPNSSNITRNKNTHVLMTFLHNNDCRNNHRSCLPAQVSTYRCVSQHQKSLGSAPVNLSYTHSLVQLIQMCSHPWEPKLTYVRHKDSVRSTRAAQCTSIRSTDLLMLYMEIIITKTEYTVLVLNLLVGTYVATARLQQVKGNCTVKSDTRWKTLLGGTGKEYDTNLWSIHTMLT